MLDKSWHIYNIEYALGGTCWGFIWRSKNSGWWVQHGHEREARRFFGDEQDPMGATSFIIEKWLSECHFHRPCGPREIKDADKLSGSTT